MVKFAEILWSIGIILSLTAIFTIVPVVIALNALAISTAIFALIWVGIAKKSLSKGSSLAKFASYLFLAIVFLLISSIFQLVIQIIISSKLTQISYILLAIAYLLLVVSAYKLMRIGKEFGFAPEAKKIRKLIKK